MTLLTKSGAYDRAAIMKNAHKRFRDGRRLGLGWTFAQCLRTAWAAARIQRQSDITTAIMGRIGDQINSHISQHISPIMPALSGRNNSQQILRMAS